MVWIAMNFTAPCTSQIRPKHVITITVMLVEKGNQVLTKIFTVTFRVNCHATFPDDWFWMTLRRDDQRSERAFSSYLFFRAYWVSWVCRFSDRKNFLRGEHMKNFFGFFSRFKTFPNGADSEYVRVLAWTGSPLTTYFQLLKRQITHLMCSAQSQKRSHFFFINLLL